MKEAEAVIKVRNTVKAVDPEKPEQEAPSAPTRAVTAIPQNWLSNFGSEYYSCVPLLTEGTSAAGEWNAQDAGKPSPRRDLLQASTEQELEEGISSIIATMREGSVVHDPTDTV